MECFGSVGRIHGTFQQTTTIKSQHKVHKYSFTKNILCLMKHWRDFATAACICQCHFYSCCIHTEREDEILSKGGGIFLYHDRPLSIGKCVPNKYLGVFFLREFLLLCLLHVYPIELPLHRYKTTQCVYSPEKHTRGFDSKYSCFSQFEAIK